MERYIISMCSGKVSKIFSSETCILEELLSTIDSELALGVKSLYELNAKG